MADQLTEPHTRQPQRHWPWHVALWCFVAASLVIHHFYGWWYLAAAIPVFGWLPTKRFYDARRWSRQLETEHLGPSTQRAADEWGTSTPGTATPH